MLLFGGWPRPTNPKHQYSTTWALSTDFACTCALFKTCFLQREHNFRYPGSQTYDQKSTKTSLVKATTESLASKTLPELYLTPASPSLTNRELWMCFSNQPPSFVYLQNCLRLCSCVGATERTDGWWWRWDCGMCCCGKPLSVASSSSRLFPPSLCSHPSSIDHVAHYKSTVSWATLQVP